MQILEAVEVVEIVKVLEQAETRTQELTLFTTQVATLRAGKIILILPKLKIIMGLSFNVLSWLLGRY